MTAPGQEVAQGAVLGPASSHSQLESSLHFQGAVAVEGEATLWTAGADRAAWPQSRRAIADPLQRDLPQVSSGISRPPTPGHARSDPKLWPQELSDVPSGRPDEAGSRFTSRPEATVEDFRQPVIERFEVSCLPLTMGA